MYKYSTIFTALAGGPFQYVCVFYYVARGSGCEVLWWVRVCVCLCVCVSVCLSVCPRGYTSNHTRDLYQLFVHVAYGRGLVLLRRRCDTLCTSGFVDDMMFFVYNGPYSGTNFATMNDFAWIFLLTIKSDRIQFSIIKAFKGHKRSCTFSHFGTVQACDSDGRTHDDSI